MMQMRVCIMVLMFFALTLPVAAQVEVYHPVEISLTGGIHDNPYLDVTLGATFYGPNGEMLTVEGFWAGADQWTIRFAPTSAGQWSWTTQSNDGVLDGQTGTISCTASDSPGFIHREGLHFTFSDGSPFVLIGDTSWRLYRSANAPLETQFKPYVDARSEQGFTTINGVLHTVGAPSINEGGSLWLDDTDYDRLQPGYFEYVDLRVEYMLSKGIVPSIILIWGSLVNEFATAQLERFTRYVVARYAAYNVIWAVAASYDSYADPDTWHTYGEIIDDYDPYEHPTTIIPSSGHSSAADLFLFSSWMDIDTQYLGDLAANLHQRVKQDRSYGLPVWSQFAAYEGPFDPADPYYYPTNLTADEVRRRAWALVMGGGYPSYGSMWTYTGNELDIELTYLDSPGAIYMQHLATLVTEHIPFGQLQPRDDLVTGGAWALVNPDSFYVIYQSNTGISFDVDLTNSMSCFDVRWYNPLTGTFTDSGAVCGASVQTFVPPAAYTGEAILVMDRSDTRQVVSVSVKSNPKSLTVAVDGQNVTAPHTFFWPTGSTHTLNAISPQQHGGIEYGFLSWSDGGSQSHDINVTVESTQFIAAFDTLGYYLDPGFTADPVQGYAPLSVTFMDTTIGQVDSLTWDFGDGSAASDEVNPTHLFSDSGDYTVSLTVSGPAGTESETKTDYIHVDPEPTDPVADFTASFTSGFEPCIIPFNDASAGPVTDWSWDFGDAGLSTETDPLHLYHSSGTYSVSLTVTDGVTPDTQQKVDYIDIHSDGDRLEDTFADGEAGDWSVVSGDWSVMDGALVGVHVDDEAIALPSWRHLEEGSLSLRMAVLSDATSHRARVLFSYGDISQFAYLELDADLNRWVLGERREGVDEEKAVWGDAVTTDQYYSVLLTLTQHGVVAVAVDDSVMGCFDYGSDRTGQMGVACFASEARFDDISFHGILSHRPVSDFSADPTEGYGPLDVTFTDLSTAGTAPIEYREWDFGDSTAPSHDLQPVHTYPEAGTYSVRLTVSNAAGADSTLKTDYITVNPLPAAPAADFVADTTSGHTPLTLRFHSLSSGEIDSYTWDFGDGTTITGVDAPFHTYDQAGTYTVSLTVQGLGGSDTRTRTDYIEVQDYPLDRIAELNTPYDLILAGQSFENPYTDVQLTAEIQGPSGENWTQEGFWLGDNGWCVRFAPLSTGTWTVSLQCNDPLINGQTFTLDCVYSDRDGFLEQQDYHFYRDGQPVFRAGDTCWRMFRSKNAPFDSLFKPYVDARADQGFNFLTGVIHTVYDPSINEGGALWNEDYDLDRLQPGYFDFVDNRIEYINQKGITTGLMLVWAQRFDDFTAAQFERFARYVVARYAAYDVLWIVSGEYTETASPSDYDLQAQIIQDSDPYHHPISIHPSGDESNSQDYALFSSWLGYVMQQINGSTDILSDAILSDRIYSLPVCNDEFGYEGPTNPSDPAYYDSNLDPDGIRKAAWTIATSGGYLTYGNIYTFTGKERIIDLDHLQSEGALYVSRLIDYFRDSVPLDQMEPDTALVDDGRYALARAGEDYVIYSPDSTTVTVNLREVTGPFRATWIDPSTLATVAGGIVPGDSTVTLESPLSTDFVLRLEKTTVGYLHLKMLLEGPYDVESDSMQTQLQQEGHLPSMAPYPMDPKCVSTIPDDVTDWVCVEFRSTPSGSASVSQSVLLRADGIATLDSSDILAVPGLEVGEHWVVVRHRNHLAVMSSAAISFSDSDTAYVDFTAGNDSAYGSLPLIELESGVWGLCAGDANFNGQVQNDDKNDYWRHQVGAAGYHESDFNCNGQVQNDDKNDYWRHNVGRGSQIP